MSILKPRGVTMKVTFKIVLSSLIYETKSSSNFFWFPENSFTVESPDIVCGKETPSVYSKITWFWKHNAL